MGNYAFTTSVLRQAVTRDAEDAESKHDMGGSIIPALVATGEAHVYDFAQNEVPGETEHDRGYWRDVGTLDTFHELAHGLGFHSSRFQPLQRSLAYLDVESSSSAGEDGGDLIQPSPHGL